MSVQVNQLATARTLASTTYASSTTTLTAGTLTIQLGTHSTDGDGNPTFTAKAGSTAVNIDVADGDTLSTLRDRINAAGAGVTASIVNDSTGARLVLRSTDTGESNGFVVSGSGGLSNLSYDPVNGVAAMVQTLPAANARAILNGIDISSESNTLKSAIDGLNITLLKTTTFPPVISIGRDRTRSRRRLPSSPLPTTPSTPCCVSKPSTTRAARRPARCKATPPPSACRPACAASPVAPPAWVAASTA